jgi:hypothetical protein
MDDLLFVNINYPLGSSNPKTWKLVRSHVSRRQHELKRSALGEALGLEQS